MPLVIPHHLHRLAVAVSDVDAGAAWLGRVLGATSLLASMPQPQDLPAADGEGVGGADMRFLWVGRYPAVLLAGGAVRRFLDRHGPGLQSLAWEVDDNWEVEHIVRDRGIGVISVNIEGRFFFMDPRDTHGVLMEWCDGQMPRDPGQMEPAPGVVDVIDLAWVSAVVADADATASWMADLVETRRVEGNPIGPEDLERTVDVGIGDVTVRLVTPRASESRYARTLQSGPRVHSFAVRVPRIDAALAALEAEGIATTHRYGALAATDPATTLGLQLEWTE
ncbi:MAG TPA: VOC family protein [Acidimicrobiales bacterium]|jgi:hypothetical protein